jgi:hypothetical protein
MEKRANMQPRQSQCVCQEMPDIRVEELIIDCRHIVFYGFV